MSAHPAERAELEATTRRRVLAWAASEGLRVSPAAAGRLVTRLTGTATTTPPVVEPSAGPSGADVVTLAPYRDRARLAR